MQGSFVFVADQQTLPL